MWDYKREEGLDFEPIAEGNYRIRIKEVEKKVSSTGKDMLAIQFEVSNSKSLLFHNIVFLEDRPEITNRWLTNFFDAFPIEEGDMNTNNWIGLVGACEVVHDEYEGKVRAKIKKFIPQDKQGDLPVWVEPENAGPKTDGDGFVTVEDGDGLPVF